MDIKETEGAEAVLSAEDTEKIGRIMSLIRTGQHRTDTIDFATVISSGTVHKAYFTEEDYERLNYLCSIMKISKSKMIRFLLYYKNIKEAPPVDYTVLIREMRAVGNNLNQLARIANAKGWINEKELRAVILSLRELEKKIASQFQLTKEDEYWQ